MAETSYTKVNVGQLKDIQGGMSQTQRTCASALNQYTNVIQSLRDSGKLEGTIIEAFNTNIAKIKSLLTAFEEYCTKVNTTINQIITEEQSIEKEFSQQYERILSVNPEDFQG